MENTNGFNNYININELKPHPNNNKLLPTLTDLDLQRLKERILKYGFTEEIEINKNNIILDGHNRINILKKYYDELNIEQVPYRIVDIPEEEENSYIISKNFDRRQLSLLMQSYLRGKYYNEVKKKLGSNQYTEKLPAGDPDKYLKSSEIVAARYGTSASTIEKDGRFVTKCNDLILQTSHDFVFDLINGKIDANKNIIIKLAEMPEEVIYKIYKFYQESQAPFKPLNQTIYKYTTRTPTEEDDYFKMPIKKNHMPKFMEILKERDSIDWRGLLDEIMQFYFDHHKK